MRSGFFDAQVLGYDAVSYTHLDVYKRQIHPRASFGDGRDVARLGNLSSFQSKDISLLEIKK